MSAPGCTCSKRFAYTEEHDSDCDLWYVDEFWAGFVAWSPDEECLVRTEQYPEGHDDPWSQAYADDIEDRLQQYEWINDEVVGCTQRDDDDSKISQMFMDKVLGNMGAGTVAPPTGEGAWEKREDGLWYRIDDDASYQSALSKLTSTAGTTTTTWTDDYSYFNHHRHYETSLVFPDGTAVQASSLVQNHTLRTNGEPDFGLYLDQGWRNEGAAIMLPWRDWGLPDVNYVIAAEAIKTAFTWAKAGMLVEVGCIGAHGRTGTVLACMAVLAGVEPTKAVSWVRSTYCNDAVEGINQEWWVKWFAAYINGEDPPKPLLAPKPAVTVPKVPTSLPYGTSPSTGNPTGADPNKPGRKARRGKRGGKRVQRSRQYQSTGGRR